MSDINDLLKSTEEYFLAFTRETEKGAIFSYKGVRNMTVSGPIDWAWGSDAQIKQKEKTASDLYLERCNQIEPLLDEAITLIERAASDYMKYDEVNVKRFMLRMEFFEYLKINNIEATELNDPEYWNGLEKSADFFRSAAEINHKDPIRTEVTTNFATAVRYYDGAQTAASSITGASGNVSRQSALGKYHETQVAAELQKMRFQSLEAEAKGHAARQAYEKKARQFEAARRLVKHEVVMQKINETQMKDGAINYNEHMLRLATRAEADYLEAFARLNAIERGLYGILGVKVGMDFRSFDSRSRIEKAITWLRSATNELARAKIDDVGMTFRITIEGSRSSSLQAMLKAGVSVQVDPKNFPGRRNVRLRGVSACLNSEARKAWVSVGLIGPEEKIEHPLHSAVKLPAVKLQLGRVTSEGFCTPDTEGGRPIMNRSPNGAWSVKSIDEYNLDDATCLHLDFHVTAISL